VGLELVHAGVAFPAHFACEMFLRLVCDIRCVVILDVALGSLSYSRKTFARLLRSPSALVAVCYRAAMPSEFRSWMLCALSYWGHVCVDGLLYVTVRRLCGDEIISAHVPRSLSVRDSEWFAGSHMWLSCFPHVKSEVGGGSC
jgi:hypothetical protein